MLEKKLKKMNSFEKLSNGAYLILSFHSVGLAFPLELPRPQQELPVLGFEVAHFECQLALLRDERLDVGLDHLEGGGMLKGDEF